jgi:pyridoxal phosphate enzyme (YggS family)
VKNPSQSQAEIPGNLAHVRAKIAAAARRAGRSASEVTLVGVSKGQSLEKIRSAYHAGLRDFGENRVEEALEKQAQLRELSEIRWHMIGHIQSRKVKRVLPNFRFIHSVDRQKIARKLDQVAGDLNLNVPVLLECNVSGETSKRGWALWDLESWPQILPMFETIQQMKHLEVRGLMTMAPWTSDEDILRGVFRSLTNLRQFVCDHLPCEWEELSMGMTDDFEIAIEEGATIVRIGRAIFGSRQEK